jgi:hypothetical protein
VAAKNMDEIFRIDSNGVVSVTYRQKKMEVRRKIYSVAILRAKEVLDK